MSLIRQVVLANAMVRIHRVTPALAAYQVSLMSSDEIDFQFQMYARLGVATEIELSVAGPTITAVNVLLPGCDARTDDGRPHGTQPCSPANAVFSEFGPDMPDSGKINRVQGTRGSESETSSGGIARTERRRDSGAVAECGMVQYPALCVPVRGTAGFEGFCRAPLEVCLSVSACRIVRHRGDSIDARSAVYRSSQVD